jgi:hypothetical protein
MQQQQQQQQMNRSSVLVLEDKQIYGIDKVHKNVLKPVEDSLPKKVITFYDNI